MNFHAKSFENLNKNEWFQAKWSGDGAGQQDQLTGEAERILKQSQSKFSKEYFLAPSSIS